MGYSSWGHKESDMTERLSLSAVCFFSPVNDEASCSYTVELF